IAFWMATPMMSRYSVTLLISGSPGFPILSDSRYASYQLCGIFGFALTSGLVQAEARPTPTPARSSRTAFCLLVDQQQKRYAASLFLLWADTAIAFVKVQVWWPAGPAGRTVYATFPAIFDLAGSSNWFAKLTPSK